MKEFNKIKKGRIGYNILEKELLKRDFDIYTPVLEDTKIDCIIIKNNKIYKLSVNTLEPYKNNFASFEI